MPAGLARRLPRGEQYSGTKGQTNTMGTSASQRSPATPEWERVRELYRQPNPDPAEVTSRIVMALDSATRQGMSDLGVALCLDTFLVSASRAAEGDIDQMLAEHGLQAAAPVAVQYASAVRKWAQERIARAGAASRFAELAVDGLGAAAMDVACGGQPGRIRAATLDQATAFIASYVQEERLHELSGNLLGYDLDRTFRYFVSRDLSDFVGNEAFPTVGHAHRLLDSVASHCRQMVRSMDLSSREQQLAHALGLSEPERVATVQHFWRQAMNQGLQLLAAGGGQ